MPLLSKRRAKTNWRSIVMTLAALYLVEWLSLLFFWPYLGKEGVGVVVALMIVSTLAVLLVHAIIGEVEQRRLDLEDDFGSVTTCTNCHRGDAELQIASFEWHVFPLVVLLQRTRQGKFCEPCARQAAKWAIMGSCVGCCLFPPFVIWDVVKNRAQLSKFKNAKGPSQSR